MTLVLISFLLLLFGAPWTLLALRRSTDATLEGLLDRICFGYALSFVALYVAAQFRLWAFGAVWGLGALACVVQLVRRGSSERPAFSLDRPGAILLGAAAVYLGLRCLPYLVRNLPIGWDAYFHMTIAESIHARGRAVHDWLPYEDMPLNYPIAVHLLQAVIQSLTGERPHVFFDLIILWFTVLTGLQIFSLGSRATGGRWTGCYAALSFWFLANMGSLYYVMWSGITNAVGMYLFLGMLCWLATDEAPLRRSVAIFAGYFLAICFVHHHVMVTAGLCLAWTAVVLWLEGERRKAGRIAAGFAASALLGAPYFGVYVHRSLSLGETEIQRYLEPALEGWKIAEKLSFGFAAAAVAGAYLAFRNKQAIATLVTQPLAAMLGLYVLVDFVLRILSQGLFETELSPFTPSRFITDAVTLLAVFAGIFFRSMHGAKDANALPLVALIVTGFFVFNRNQYLQTFTDSVPKAKQGMYEWIRTNTTPDTVVIDGDFHATYLTERMSSGFPLPTSEFSGLASNRKRLRRIGVGKQPADSAGVPVVTVVKRGEKIPDGKQLWRKDGYRVIQSYTPPR